MDVTSQKEYLKKYLGIGKVPGEKKKKKKIKGISNRVKIIDDDAETNISSIIIEEDLQANEDAPQIVAVIDERPPSLRVDEKTKNPLWQPIGSVDSVHVSEQKHTIARFKIACKSSDRQFTHNVDTPPLKKRTGNSSEKVKNHDPSPSRTTMEKCENNKNEKNNPRYESETNDVSPVRKPGRNDSCPSKEMKEDDSLPRPKRDDDVSPPRKQKSHDISPPRKTRRDDNSPPREKLQKDSRYPSRRLNDDMSPPRKRCSNDESSPKRNKKGSLSNSPPRKRFGHEAKEPQARRKGESDVEEKMSTKMDKTLDGKTAGLQYAHELADETNELRQREERLFKNLSKEQTGENAETVFRDRKSGKRRNLEEEEERDKSKREEEEKKKEKYSRWGRGLVQVENRNQKMQEELYEMSKPLARYADDEDLERFLKEQEREGDPMLQYIRNKKRKKAADAGVAVKPEFEGNYMPNRFGIKPGHRWDGVDRSNGYEKKWFEVQNAKTAQQEDVYKWSTEDM